MQLSTLALIQIVALLAVANPLPMEYEHENDHDHPCASSAPASPDNAARDVKHEHDTAPNSSPSSSSIPVADPTEPPTEEGYDPQANTTSFSYSTSNSYSYPPSLSSSSDSVAMAEVTTLSTEEGDVGGSSSDPAQEPTPTSMAYPDSTGSTKALRIRGTSVPIKRSSKRFQLNKNLLVDRDTGGDFPLFGSSTADMIKGEMAGVRNKYAKAVQYLSGVSPGEVDLGFDPTLKLGDLVGGNSTVSSVNSTSTSTSTIPSSPSSSSSVGLSAAGPSTSLTSSSTATGTLSPPGGAGSTSTMVSQAQGSNPSSRVDSEESGKTETKRLERRSTSGQIPLTDWISGGMDVLYYGGITVGSQSQQLSVDFDTGSADLWLPVDCQDCTADQFKSTQSKTYKDTGEEFAIEYGTGSVSGTLAQDTVSLAGIQVSDQYFGAVDEESEDFDGNPNSGVMGMAFSSIASSGKPTPFENLVSSNSIASPLFGFHLTRHVQQGSTLCIGCVDGSKFKSGIEWVPVISKTYWSVSMSGLSALGKGNALSKALVAAIDTGTTLLYVPDAIAENFYAQIPGSSRASQFGPGFYQFPCDAPLQVTFSFASKAFKMDSGDFNLGRTASGSSLCVGGILGMGDDFPEYLAIVGDAFLKSWYSVYDYSNGARVGFAESINN